MGIFQKLSLKSRQRKLDVFFKTFSPDKNTSILDVGAEINPDGDLTLQLIDGYPWKDKIAALNISENYVAKIKKHYPEIKTVIGDACKLPYDDNTFDIVFSNAVIEHVGDLERQTMMASEIMRVGKRWFVTTPNRWYPFEFHMRLPFVTWLPGHGYLTASKLIRYSHAQKRYISGRKYANLRLLSSGELRKMFPGSKIIKQRITLMPETLIVIGNKSGI